jgi:hypothetical protein
LGSVTNVGKIKVYNRTDCCGERLDDYTVKVLDASMAQVWSSFQSNPAGTPTSLTTGGKTGRYVEVQLSGSGCLSIAEVEVFAQNDPSVPGNVAPTCAISAPANNAVYAIGANVDITATAADSDGSVSQVEFYINNSKVATDNASPYNYTATGLAAATHTIYAKATDNNGATKQSTSVNIRVNAVPTVSITAPSNGSVIKPGDNVTITANASDADGSITLVAFYQGTTKLGEDSSSPYSFTWTSPANGNYALTAVATDNNSANTTSAVVNISVKVSSEPAKYRYLKLTGEKLLKEGALIEEVYWLVGTSQYPTPRLDNNTAYRVTASPNIDNAWHAYNGNDQPWQVLYSIPASITLDMLASKEIGVTGIKIKALNNERGFADLSCHGSNDGTNFTLIARATGLTAANYPGGLVTLTFANLKSGAMASSINSTNTLNSEIFPNPASQQVFLKLVASSANVEVFDLMGQSMLINANVSNGQAVDISTLKGGIYLLKVSNNAGNVDVHKLIVK